MTKVAGGNGFAKVVAYAAAALLLVGGAVGCGDDSSEDTRGAPVRTTTPESTFAPLVHLHSGERWWPIGADAFVDYSTLRWANTPCLIDDTLTIGGPRRRLRRDEPAPVTVPRRLGGASPYRHRPYRPDCVGRDARSYATNQHTRPFDDGRAASLREGEGFYLDLLTARLDGRRSIERRGGQAFLRGLPVYYERRPTRVDGIPGMRISYWMLYGFNGYPDGSEADYALGHEGDWERVDVLLQREGNSTTWTPTEAVLYPEKRPRQVPWDSLKLVGDDGGAATHPVIHAAREAHTSYPSPGRRAVSFTVGDERVRTVDVTAACPRCPRWRTWDRLRSLRAEPWFGYGGGWGRDYLDGFTSGPAGPSPFSR